MLQTEDVWRRMTMFFYNAENIMLDILQQYTYLANSIFDTCVVHTYQLWVVHVL